MSDGGNSDEVQAIDGTGHQSLTDNANDGIQLRSGNVLSGAALPPRQEPSEPASRIDAHPLGLQALQQPPA